MSTQETDTTNIGIRMAKPSAEDMAAANGLLSFLTIIDQGYFDLEGEEPYDAHRDDHVQRVGQRLLDFQESNPGTLFRIIHGMWVLLDPANEIVDPDLDYLEHHPSRKPVAASSRDDERQRFYRHLLHEGMLAIRFLGGRLVDDGYPEARRLAEISAISEWLHNLAECAVNPGLEGFEEVHFWKDHAYLVDHHPALAARFPFIGDAVSTLDTIMAEG